MKMKKIGIYFSDSEDMFYPFDQGKYFEAYRDLIIEIEKKDVLVYIVRGDSYTGKGTFKNSNRFENGELIDSGEVKVDLIFNRDDKNTIPYIDDCKIINHPDFDELCVDKLKTFEAFPDISPKTAYIHSYKEYLEYKEKFNLKDDEFVVLKKNFETEGKGIYIGENSGVSKDTYTDWSDILLQEFIDSSVGIPGLVDGLHDIRIHVVNGKILYPYIRQPKEGGFLANIAQGGTGFGFDISKISDDLLKIVEEINDGLGKYYPIVYSADFMNSKKGYKLVELNSRPGLGSLRKTENDSKFNYAIIDMLLGAV